jgi:hypothetical protein
MDNREIFAAIDVQIGRLQEAKRLLGGSVATKGPRRRRKLSAAARRKISLAQKARWAKQKQAPKHKRTISAAGRRRIAAAQRARWSKVKAKQKKAA